MQITYHFYIALHITDFDIKSIMLKLVPYIGQHAGENIDEEVSKVVSDFGLDSKQIVYFTDNGYNIVKACNYY